MIRATCKRDIDQIQKIHEKFFISEFPISDLSNLSSSFVCVDENDKVITAGGIRSIIEAVLVTDKDVAVEVRQRALIRTLLTAQNMTKQAGHSQLHVFVQDEKWMRHLIRHGFIETIGKSLVIGV